MENPLSMKNSTSQLYVTRHRGLQWCGIVACGLILVGGLADSSWAQSVSGVKGFNGGVAPLFNLVGPGNLYIDNQGTQGFITNPGNNFESYNFRNPTTGQAWSGALMTFGPQLSIGLIQGANQSGSPLVLPGPPRELSPLSEIDSTLLDIP
jgi:hypothetical protein